LAACVLFLSLAAAAQPGGATPNGAGSAPPGIMVPGFLFQPAFPLSSLKTVPIWPELEKLLKLPETPWMGPDVLVQSEVEPSL
jgi:hypothetical protein